MKTRSFKKIIVLIALVLTQISFTYAQPMVEWVNSLSGVNDDDEGNSITTDNLGNVYTVGRFSGSVDFDPGPSVSILTSTASWNAFISKFDAAGNFVWAKKIDGGLCQAFGVTIDNNGNIYVTGFFSGPNDFDPGPGVFNLMDGGSFDGFVLKLDSSGDFVWAKNVVNGSGQDYSLSVNVDSNGNVYTTGRYRFTADFDPGPGTFNLSSNTGTYDVFISKLDSNGNFLWAKSAGGSEWDDGRSIVLDASGNCYITGYFKNTVDFDPGPGVVNLTSPSTGYDMYILKLDASGNFVWVKHISGTGQENAESIYIDGSGNIFTTGRYAGTVDFDPGPGVFNLTNSLFTTFVLKLDSNGNFLWAKDMPGQGCGFSIKTDTGGNIYTAGYFQQTTDFDPGPGNFSLTNTGGGTAKDNFICKWDANGNFIWAVQTGSNLNDETLSLALDGANNIYTTGRYQGTANFGVNGNTINHTAQGAYDIFIHKMSQCSFPSQSSTISGNNTICAGTTQTYSVTNDASATSYTWTLPSGWSGTSTTNSITATAGATGGSITVTANNACGSSIAQTLAITVNPTPGQPSAISGNNTLCAGVTQTYSVTNDAAATNYTWTLPSGWSGTSTTNSITATTGTSSGSITVNANNECGSSTPQTLAMTINNVPAQPSTISGNNTLCSGVTQTYSVTNDVNATSYTWILPSGWSGTSITNSITATVGVNNGNITVTSNNNCGSSTEQMLNITVNVLPSVVYTQTPSILCANHPAVSLTGGTPLGGVYSGTGVSAGNFDPGLAGVGIYTITYSYTDGNNCSNTDTQQIEVDACLELNEQENEQISIYPNPFVNNFTISFTDSGARTIELVDVLGKQIRLIETQDQNTVISTKDLSSGTYYLKVIDENLIFKVIKN